METESDSTIYITNAAQRQMIEEGRAQIARGEFLTNEEVEAEIDKWLEEN